MCYLKFTQASNDRYWSYPKLRKTMQGQSVLRRFDYINPEQVFEHLINPLDTLKHLAKSLGQEGLIKISLPNSRIALKKLKQSGSYVALSDKHIMLVQPLEHINCFKYTS